jgi:integrase
MSKGVSLTYWPARPQKDKWVVKFPQGGRRAIRFFVTEREAKAFAREKEIELAQEGRRRSGITPEDRRAIEMAAERGFSILDAVNHYAAHVAVVAKSVSVNSAIDELLDIRTAENRSAVHLADLKYRLRAFAQEYGDRLVAEVATRDVDAWLTGLACGAQTKANHRRAVHNLFGFALSRGYCSSNPVSSAMKIKVPPAKIGILTVSQVQALLAACQPEILPSVTIGMFAGLRVSEIGKLDWRDIDLKRGFIEVGASKTKTARRRLVHISENLSVWLAPHFQGNGRVRPSLDTYRYKFAKALKTSGIKHWPDNALRHSFASYHLAAYQDAAATALQLGHTESRTLFAHYRELVHAEDALAYWQIKPDDNVVAFRKIV